MRRNAYKVFLVVLVASAALMSMTKNAFALTPAEGRVIHVAEASYYGPGFHGGVTANCERFDARGFTVAVPPEWVARDKRWLGTRVEIKNPANGRTLVAKVNDTGAFHKKYNRDMDVSERIAEKLGFKEAGTARVVVAVLEVPDAPQYGDKCQKEKIIKKRRK